MPFSPGVSPPPVLSPRPAWLVVHRRGLALRSEGGRRVLPETRDLAALGVDPSQAHYLGTWNGEDCLALELPHEPPAPFELHGFRTLYPELGEEMFAVAGRAGQIIDWATTHRFCGRCATLTTRDPDERCMRCPSCALATYPRISPAIIVLVRRGDEALLARSAKFPLPFFSTLAGFAEVGESLEETLVREVREEVGVEVTDLRYFGSQPWPFPHSLMVGFHARYAGGEIVVDGQEIAEARWFRADALPMVPPPLSIARRLIDEWVGEVTAR